MVLFYHIKMQIVSPVNFLKHEILYLLKPIQSEPCHSTFSVMDCIPNEKIKRRPPPKGRKISSFSYNGFLAAFGGMEN